MTNEIQTPRQHDVLRGFFELNYLALVTDVEVATHGAKSDLVADVHTALTLQWRPESYRLSSAKTLEARQARMIPIRVAASSLRTYTFFLAIFGRAAQLPSMMT